ncbi:MAG TPA: protein translocase subunit SecD [Terracidiphilus sp.]|jgi:preprotein translocase subunit SecD|nr:protein translocase subunit SecD [Terracidiphilus sp.]
MKKNLNGRIALIVAVLLIFIYGIFGIPSGFTGKALLASITQRIHLGLDLRGGAHLILQVQVLEAVSQETDDIAGQIQQSLKAASLTFSQVIKPDPKKPEVIQIQGIAPGKSSDVRSLLDSKFSNEYDISGGSDNNFTLTMKPPIEVALEKKTVQQAIETIRDRVDTLGVSEPIIQEYGLGENQILVELPGVEDLDRVKSLIQETARLEIHPVISGPFQDEQAALASVAGNIPPDEEMLHGSGQMASGSDADSVFILQRVPIVAGSDFRSADPSTNPNTGQRNVTFTLTNEAGDKFYDYTSQNVGHSMAVILGNRVREVANIKSAIRDRGEIEGSFSQDEVDILSKMLRTGALPASLVYLEDRTVGASLGADSIKEGVTAAVVGVLLVMAFMLIYYRGSGVNADLALFLNLVILLGFMGFSGATLTLPGIAGVILTIGMGVDSNVLIFERIREEVRAGKAPSAAVDQGFAHAWVTIIDTHVTTIVSAAILFVFGTGPVKGFAVTLTFGLAANLFTAVYVSRLIFEAHLNRLKPGELVSI